MSGTPTWALARSINADRRQRIQIHVDRTGKVDVVVDLVDGHLIRHAVLEVQRTEPGLNRVQRGDLCRNRRCHLYLRRLSAHAAVVRPATINPVMAMVVNDFIFIVEPSFSFR